MCNKIYINREPYKSNGNEYFSYFISSILHDRPIRINLAPIDIGGYELLDIVFAYNSTAELITTEENGKRIYKAMSYDDDGRVYECEVKPLHGSDRVKLKLILEKGGDAL